MVARKQIGGEEAFPRAGRDRVYSLLLEDILTGQLPAGVRLIEHRLTERLGVSRTPLREALFRLEREGFVQTELRRGFRVAPLTEEEARQIYPIIGSLEALAIVESGSLIVTTIPALLAANEQLRKAARNPADALAADAQFHRALVSACPNLPLQSLLTTFHQRAFRYEQLFMRETALVERSTIQHEAIIDAVTTGRIAEARKAIETNYMTGMDSVISKLRMMSATTPPSRPARSITASRDSGAPLLQPN
jgi:DNA-binding GntR family transcriptional regulator